MTIGAFGYRVSSGIRMTEGASVPFVPEFFSALADRTRLRIVNLLARRSLCVSDLQRILAQPQSTVSRHPGRLEAAWLVRIVGTACGPSTR